MEKREELIRLGAEVLFPQSAIADSDVEGFVILSSDCSRDPHQLQLKNLRLLETCDFLYVYNPDGRMGLSAAMEIGYALHCGIEVISLAPAEDVTLRQFVQPVTDLKQFIETYSIRSLADLQGFCRRFVEGKGFEGETVLDTMLLLQEELGELARSVRRLAKIRMDVGITPAQSEIGSEIADCIKYLAIVANQTGVDLESEFLRKQWKDLHRLWAVPLR
jgi:NTP pyrophosphatase (non-canonical NTP hydrolase)